MKLQPAASAVLATLVAASMLAGCGRSPVAPVVKTTSSKTATTTRTAAATPAAGANPADSQQVNQVLAAVQKAQQTTPGFTATIEALDKGNGSQETDEIQVAYKKPGTLHLNMLKASGQAQGALILWTGGDTVQVKVTVGFLPITTSLSVNDDRLKSRNGWTLKQTESNAIFRVLLDPAAQVQIVGKQAGDAGHQLTMLQVKSPQTPAPGDHEIIGIDSTTNLPGCRLIYKGTDLLYRLTIKNMKLGTPSSSAFSL